MIYQCYKHKGDFMNEEITREQKPRIVELYERLQVLGNEVVELQKAVTRKRSEYLGIDAKGTEKPESDKGTLNSIEWMLGDIMAMVMDVREYVDTI